MIRLVVTTDANGFYNATNVRPATYQVSVEATGYAGAPASLAVRVGSRQRRELRDWRPPRK